MGVAWGRWRVSGGCEWLMAAGRRPGAVVVSGTACQLGTDGSRSRRPCRRRTAHVPFPLPSRHLPNPPPPPSRLVAGAQDEGDTAATVGRRAQCASERGGHAGAQPYFPLDAPKQHGLQAEGLGGGRGGGGRAGRAVGGAGGGRPQLNRPSSTPLPTPLLPTSPRGKDVAYNLGPLTPVRILPAAERPHARAHQRGHAGLCQGLQSFSVLRGGVERVWGDGAVLEAAAAPSSRGAAPLAPGRVGAQTPASPFSPFPPLSPPLPCFLARPTPLVGAGRPPRPAQPPSTPHHAWRSAHNTGIHDIHSSPTPVP